MAGTLTTSAVTQTGFTMNWSAASDNVAVTGYEVSIDGGTNYTNVGNVLTVTETNMSAGTTYQLRVRAYDAAGNRATPLTSSVTTSAATVPGAPTIGTAVAGDGYVDVAFTAPASNGGATITSYTATLSTGESNTGTTSPIRVTAANGTARTAHVTATNSVGTGAASAESNSVTPAAAGSNLRFTISGTTQTESGTGPYTYTGTGGTFSSSPPHGAMANKSFAANTDGSLTIKVTAISGTANEVMMGVKSTNVVGSYTAMDETFYTDSTKYTPTFNGSGQSATNALTPAVGDYMRISRVGSTHYGHVSKDNGQTWTQMFARTGQSTGVMYVQALATGSGAFQTVDYSGLV
jgi:chitodextrinase